MNNSIAVLTNDKRYNLFIFGDLRIKFKTSPYLIRYDAINKWDNGYIECMASYSTVKGSVEDYIDLRFIADRLQLPEDVFKGIKEVRVE